MENWEYFGLGLLALMTDVLGKRQPGEWLDSWTHFPNVYRILVAAGAHPPPKPQLSPTLNAYCVVILFCCLTLKQVAFEKPLVKECDQIQSSVSFNIPYVNKSFVFA